MLPMHETKAVMTADVRTVGTHTPIYDAVKILLDSDVTGLPVVNDDMTLAGVITEKDVLRLLSRSEDDSATVEQFMTRDPTCFFLRHLSKQKLFKGFIVIL